MLTNKKISYTNINKETLETNLNKKIIYYANVVMWTILFSLPLFWLLDYLFMPTEWANFFIIRLTITIITHGLFLLGIKFRWSYLNIVAIFITIYALVFAFICGTVASTGIMPYFLWFSVFILLINITLFWPVIYPIILCLVCDIIIVVLFASKNRIDKYQILVAQGGAVFFIISSFSCLVAYNRYIILKRDIVRNILIDEANNKLLIQNEKINDQKYVIEGVNRKLKVLNDYKHSTINILLNDFKNFTGSISTCLTLLYNNADNISQEQKEILNYIKAGNEQLKYLSEKLALSANKEENKVDFNYERFDIGPVIEKTVTDITADAAQLKQVGLQLHLAPMPIMVYLDRLFFDQVLFKLFTNAISYAEKGSTITVHTNIVNNKCFIEVINWGKLIGNKAMDDLFNKLPTNTSINQTVFNEADMNMGFAVAKKLTEIMGGAFIYSSNETTGNYYRIAFNSTR